jgi:hypothetical protein
MRYLKIILTLFLSCAVVVIYAQPVGVVEKEQINEMKLYRFWIENTPTGKRMSMDATSFIDGSARAYFDNNRHLRKFVAHWEYPESSSTTIAYYNEQGDLMHILFSEFQPEGYSYQGVACKTHSEEYCDSVSFEYDMQYIANTGGRFDNTHVRGFSDRYPRISPEYDYLARFSHTDSLGLHLDRDYSLSVGNHNLVTFSQPNKGQTSIINSAGVTMWELPSISANTIKTLDLGTEVKIVDVIQGETLWYRVEWKNIAGYIFGAFLEPVEQQLTD